MIGRFICYPTCGGRAHLIDIDKPASRIEIAGWLKVFARHTDCRCCRPVFKGDDGVEAEVGDDGRVHWFRLEHDYSQTPLAAPEVCC